MPETLTTTDDFEQYIRSKRNWGRWGPADEVGTINLVTPKKRLEAASVVRSGRLVSLSRPLPTVPEHYEQPPAQHYMKRIDKVTGGFATDYVGVSCHGHECTHLDALCHLWDLDGLFNGRDPNLVITFNGATFGSIESWGQGIITRGVLLDVPLFRGEPYVDFDKPVHASELEAIVETHGLEVGPGDAVAVYCGREKFDRVNRGYEGLTPRRAPGLHGSCLHFLRERDAAVLLWDMMDCIPSGNVPGVHTAIAAFGLALVDNALLEPLSVACAEQGQYEFQLSLAPLRIIGGTGSPVNPLAML